MFNKDFYPTPTSVIEKMLWGIDLTDKVVFEPSAGKGNIVDFLMENNAKQVLACENNPDLSAIVSSKCTLLAQDFFTVKSHDISHVDLIVMNPPFSEEEKHILHAWEIAPSGCSIISLCNDSVVVNADTEKKKQIAKLISLYGRSEYFGDCFIDAERKTGVEVSCLFLTKPARDEEDFSGYFSMEEDFGEPQSEGITTYDFVRDIVSRYVAAVKTFDEMLLISSRMKELTSHITEHRVCFGAFESNYSGVKSYVTKDEYRKQLQKDCWLHLFGLMKMGKYLTKGVREDINKFVEKQTEVPFTMTNIYRMVNMIVGTHGERMQKVLVEAFEKICGFAWKDNCTGGEYWKTNSDYKVNRKFIHPYICEGASYGYKNANVKLYYGGEETIMDIVRALCFMTATNYEDIQHLRDFVRNCKNERCIDYYGKECWKDKGTLMEWGQWYEWGFFRIRAYKKGTMHFEFIDEGVWEQFNKYVAEFRGWRLPENSRAKNRTKQNKTEIEKINPVLF